MANVSMWMVLHVGYISNCVCTEMFFRFDFFDNRRIPSKHVCETISQ